MKRALKTPIFFLEGRALGMRFRAPGRGSNL